MIDADTALNEWLEDNGRFTYDDTVEQALARAVDYVPYTVGTTQSNALEHSS